MGIFGVTGLAARAGAVQKGSWNKDVVGVSRTSLKPLRAIPTTCEQCPAGCGIIAYLDGERLVQLLGNPNHPNNKGGICAKGIAGINLVNDPERLLYPMKRSGPRGSGRWTMITWDEAYSDLSLRLRELMRSKRTVDFVLDKGQDDPLLDRFIDALGSARIIDRPGLKNLNRDKVIMSMTGSPFLIEDVGRSRTVLNFGANPYASHDQFLGMARRLVQARVDRGTKLYTFDVRLSETAAKSDAWFPLRAGTDGIVALAMAKVIVEKELADKEFLERKTNSSLSKIKQHLSPYGCDVAEKESGVKAHVIEQMAVEFAAQRPSVAIMGGGVDDHENGSQNVRCIALLNWLVGNLEEKGGVFFPRFPSIFQPNADDTQDVESNLDNPIRGVKELLDGPSRIDTYFAYLSNPAYTDPDCKSIDRLLSDEKKVSFLVVMDTHLTETGMLADLVLPSATYLEGWGLTSAPSLDMIPILNLRQPVVSLISTAKALRSPTFDMGKLLEPMFRPKGESEEIGNVCSELARRMGGVISRRLPFKDTKDYVTEIVSSILGLKDLDALSRMGLWVDDTEGKNNHRSGPEQGYSRIVPKVKIFFDSMNQKDQPALPEYRTIERHQRKEETEFVLTSYKSNLRAKGTANSKWAREIFHENRLWMNEEAAKKLGIKNKDRVRVTSSVGSLITRVLTTNRIHPESVALAEGLGHTAVGNVAKARRFKSKDQDTNLIWWEKQGNGVNPNEIIEARADPEGGGYALKDTVIRVEKI